MEGYDNLVCTHSDETMWVLEAEGASQVRLASIAKTIFGGRPFSKVVWSQGYSVEVVGVVKDEDVEGIVLCRVGECDTRCAYGGWEAQVQDQVGVGGVLLLADIGGADAQDGVVLQHPPQKTPGRVVMLSVVYGSSGGQVPGAICPLLLSIIVESVQTAVPGPGGRRKSDVDNGGGRGGLKVHSGFLEDDWRV